MPVITPEMASGCAKAQQFKMGTFCCDENNNSANRHDYRGKEKEKEETGEVCVICLESLSIAVTTDGCNHSFCLCCLEEWTKHQSTCPICRKSYTVINPCGICGRGVKKEWQATLDDCGHVFCHHCIHNWSRISSKCPKCKAGFSNISSPLSDDTCYICFGPVDIKSFSDSCNHPFCLSCTRKWMMGNSKCPVCWVTFSQIVIQENSDKCAICTDVARVKTTTDSCKHSFCFKCIRDWSKEHKTCPVCPKKFSTIVPETEHNTCLRCLKEASTRSTTDSCSHPFCYKCIRDWKDDISSKCPICSKKFKSIITNMADDICRICLGRVYIKCTTNVCDQSFCFKCIRARKVMKKTCPHCFKSFSSIVIEKEQYGDTCLICLKKASHKCITDACEHTFCYACIKKKSDNSETACPVCCLKFSEIRCDLPKGTCMECLKPAKLPSTTDGCEHLFCYECIRDRKLGMMKHCPACRKSFKKIITPESGTTCFLCFGEVKIRSTTEVCGHPFCHKCPREWKRHNSLCPVCDKRFSNILTKINSSKCLICWKKAVKKSTTDACEHPFCYTCIRNWNRKTDNCSVCSADFTEILGYEPELRCSLCYLEAIVPSLTDSCRHAFCLACIKGHNNKRGGFCPVCFQEFFEILPIKDMDYDEEECQFNL